MLKEIPCTLYNCTTDKYLELSCTKQNNIADLHSQMRTLQLKMAALLMNFEILIMRN